MSSFFVFIKNARTNVVECFDLLDEYGSVIFIANLVLEGKVMQLSIRSPSGQSYVFLPNNTLMIQVLPNEVILVQDEKTVFKMEPNDESRPYVYELTEPNCDTTQLSTLVIKASPSIIKIYKANVTSNQEFTEFESAEFCEFVSIDIRRWKEYLSSYKTKPFKFYFKDMTSNNFVEVVFDTDDIVLDRNGQRLIELGRSFLFFKKKDDNVGLMTQSYMEFVLITSKKI